MRPGTVWQPASVRLVCSTGNHASRQPTSETTTAAYDATTKPDRNSSKSQVLAGRVCRYGCRIESTARLGQSRSPAIGAAQRRKLPSVHQGQPAVQGKVVCGHSRRSISGDRFCRSPWRTRLRRGILDIAHFGAIPLLGTQRGNGDPAKSCSVRSGNTWAKRPGV